MHWKQLIPAVAATILAQSAQAEALTRDPFCVDGQIQTVDGALVIIEDMQSTLDECLTDASAASAVCQAAFVDAKYFIAKRPTSETSQSRCLNDYLFSMKPYDIAASSAHMRLLNKTVIYNQGLKSFIDTKAYRQFEQVFRSSNLLRSPGAASVD